MLEDAYLSRYQQKAFVKEAISDWPNQKACGSKLWESFVRYPALSLVSPRWGWILVGLEQGRHLLLKIAFGPMAVVYFVII